MPIKRIDLAELLLWHILLFNNVFLLRSIAFVLTALNRRCAGSVEIHRQAHFGGDDPQLCYKFRFPSDCC